MKQKIEKIKDYIRNNKLNVGLVVALIVIILGSVFVYNKVFVKHLVPVTEEVDLPFDPSGPYALLYPRRDGQALVLDIIRVADVDALSYDLAYQSNGIDRGVHGDIKKLDDNNKKDEYSQEILFGTCSQGFTSGGAHCVFDPNVENGTLTLHIQKGEKGYRMITTWHLQKPDVALGTLTSGDGHFTYHTDASRDDLATTAYSIVNDLSGLPKLPDGKSVLGKVYALNVPQARNILGGQVSIELENNPPAGAQIAKYTDSNNSWKLWDTKVATNSASTLTAGADGAGIFAVLIDTPKK